MLDFILKAGTTVLFGMIQLLAGSAVGVFIAVFLNRSGRSGNSSKIWQAVLLIAASSAVGLVLPLGAFGFIPVAAGLFTAGLKLQYIVPMLVSGLLFSIVTPFTDPSFVWRTGAFRVFFAFAAACIAGLLLLMMKSGHDRMHKLNMHMIPVEAGYFKALKKSIPKVISSFGFYLVLGAIADTLFKSYILYNLPGWIFNSEYGKEIPVAMTRLGIVGPLVSLAIQILYVMVNLVNLSAIVSIFKTKGLLFLYVLLAVCSVLLGLTAFI